RYCMERCTTAGSDPICDGGETCVATRTGNVCFDPQAAANGYTDPDNGSPPPTPPSSPPPPSDPSNCGMTTEEAEVFRLANEERTSRGETGLACNANAVLAARAHSKDMCDHRFFSHTSLDGRTPSDRLRAAGVSFSAAGENIGAGYQTAQAMHD